jgi:dTDP-4-dehydrorhamnose reductase
MRILVTGREGQLARSLIERGGGRPHLELIALGRPELDLELPGSADQAVRRISPDVVINAAAYTAVDQAEDEPARAFRINGDAVGEIAAAAHAIGARLIHVSTDYVFDGTATEPYRVDAPTVPLGVYGRSKLLGEDQARAGCPDHLIVRTAWVYSPWGKNFVRTMLSLAETRDELSVVADQVGNPTNALDLAEALLSVVETDAVSGTFHFGGADEMSWAAFAERILETSARFGGPTAAVRPILSRDWPTKAARPQNSRLETSAFVTQFGIKPTALQDTLGRVVERLVAHRAAASPAR